MAGQTVQLHDHHTLARCEKCALFDIQVLDMALCATKRKHFELKLSDYALYLAANCSLLSSIILLFAIAPVCMIWLYAEFGRTCCADAVALRQPLGIALRVCWGEASRAFP